MLHAATKNLIATAQNPARKPSDVDAAARQFFEAMAKASKSENEEQMAALAEHYDLPDYHRGAFLAIVCGALVERGCDPQPMAAKLRLKLKSLLEAAGRLADACRARMPDRADDVDEDDDESEDDDDGSPENAAFEEARRQVAAKMPKENAAWEALGTFWRPGIAVYSKSDLARMAARELRPLAQPIAEFHPGAHWLQMILSVFDDEPIVVIEPETNTGVLARIGGVVDNFQLHVLLMDAFPGSTAVRRVPFNVVEIARGNGPQEGGEEDIVTGYWNLYTYRALQANGQLPPGGEFSSSTHWIWNEGLPEDIPQLEGRRVVLLGQPSFERTWKAMRMFDYLPAKLTIERKLSAAEVSEWLQKMLAAKS